MKRIQVAILDDQPVRSGLPKLNQLAYLTQAKLDQEEPRLEILDATGSAENLGVRMMSVSPAELISADPAEWEYTIFLVDVNWHEIPPDAPGFEDMPEEQKKSYGVELAEEIFAIRENFDPDSIHVVFFSNSRADLVDSEVQRWQKEGIPNVSALFLGAGQYTSPKLLEDVLSAYGTMVSLILRKVKPECTGSVLKAASAALKASSRGSEIELGMEAFVGDAGDEPIDGFRLKDLAFPFLNVPRGLRCKALQAWYNLFDSKYLRVAPIVISQAQGKGGLMKQPSEASLVLQSILRYGLRGQSSSSSQRLAPSIRGICFADFYLFGANILQETQLTDPSFALDKWLTKGLGEMAQNPNDWNFFYPLNSCLSNDLGGQLTAASSRNVPDIFKDPAVWSVERAGWNPDAALKFRKYDQRPAIFWQLEVDPTIYVDCPHLMAQHAADAFRTGSNSSLQDLYDVWRGDPEHLELLEILAEELEQVPGLKITQNDLTELGQRFASAASLMERAINNVERVAKKLSQEIQAAPNHPERLRRLLQQISDYAAPRLNGWRELRVLFLDAANSCDIPHQSFKDMYGGQFALDG